LSARHAPVWGRAYSWFGEGITGESMMARLRARLPSAIVWASSSVGQEWLAIRELRSVTDSSPQLTISLGFAPGLSLTLRVSDVSSRVAGKNHFLCGGCRQEEWARPSSDTESLRLEWGGERTRYDALEFRGCTSQGELNAVRGSHPTDGSARQNLAGRRPFAAAYPPTFGPRPS
jgi:hypothetical protein